MEPSRNFPLTMNTVSIKSKNALRIICFIHLKTLGSSLGETQFPITGLGTDGNELRIFLVIRTRKNYFLIKTVRMWE